VWANKECWFLLVRLKKLQVNHMYKSHFGSLVLIKPKHNNFYWYFGLSNIWCW
jgi:hypothetical protein